MAMTKESCIQAGAELFRIGLERPEGNSWQAKAMQSGYDCAQTDVYDLKQEDKAEELAMHKEIINAPPAYNLPADYYDVVKPTKSHPACHHLDILERLLSVESNPFRAQRLTAKIVKLASKWANRGVMW